MSFLIITVKTTTVCCATLTDEIHISWYHKNKIQILEIYLLLRFKMFFNRNMLVSKNIFIRQNMPSKNYTQ